MNWRGFKVLTQGTEIITKTLSEWTFWSEILNWDLPNMNPEC